MPSLPNPSDAAHRRLWRGVGAPWLVTGPHQATPRAASGAGGAGATARQLGFARASRSEDHSWRAQALTAISKCVPRTSTAGEFIASAMACAGQDGAHLIWREL